MQQENEGNWAEMQGGHGHGHGNKKMSFLNLKRYQIVVVGCIAVILLLFFIVVIDSFTGNDSNKSPDTPPSNSSTPSPPEVDEEAPPIVVVVSFDGFRHSYLNASDMSTKHPTFDEFARNGVSMPIRPVFPSLTFPNHYAIATGLYAESHGIVNNVFYDPDFKETFAYTQPSSSDSKWWLGEPIWVTTVKQNKRSAIYFWPGSESNISGYRPTEYKKFDSKVSLSDRVDTAIEWAHQPLDTRPSLIMVYMEPVDHNGHSYGPDDHTAIGQAISEVDDALLRLQTGLEDVKNVTFILVSDHGMAELVQTTSYAMKSIANSTLFSDTIWPTQSGTLVHVWPSSTMDSQNVDAWSESIQKESKKTIKKEQMNLSVYQKKDIPERYHYQNSNRIPPIVAVADNGYYVSRDPIPIPMKGAHGYDNTAPDMQGIFYARGPLFKTGYSSEESLPNTNVYNIVCHILGLVPAPNNGSDPTTLPLWK